jgi:hypothetical protein
MGKLSLVTEAPALGQHNDDEVGDIDCHKKSTHHTRNLPMPDKSQKHQVNTHHDE